MSIKFLKEFSISFQQFEEQFEENSSSLFINTLKTLSKCSMGTKYISKWSELMSNIVVESLLNISIHINKKEEKNRVNN